MKEIRLSKQGKNKGRYVALVDDEDYDYLMQWDWHVDIQKNTVYAARNKKTEGKIVNTLMHREIVNVANDMEVDHLDHNGLNNQKNNLRICTHKQNMQNKNSSGYKGVRIKKGKYISAVIKVDYVSIYIGRFRTIKAAAIAYDKAAIKYFGEFAKLNFPK